MDIPFGGRHVDPAVRQGLEAVAKAANETNAEAERCLRAALERGRLPAHDRDLAYNSTIAEVRRQALLALVRVGFKELRRREAALLAQQAR